MKRFQRVLAILVLAALTALPAAAHGDDVGMVRVAHFIGDGPAVDISINGEVVWEGVEPGIISPWFDVAPGEVTVEAWVDGESIMSTTTEAAAGHRVSVLAVGQASDETTKFEALDETALIGDADLSGSVFRIIYNNVAGSPPVSFYEENHFLETNIEYGTYSAQAFPAFSWDTGWATVGDDPEDIYLMFDDAEDQSAGFWEPYTVYLYALMGAYPGEMFEDYTINGGNAYVTTDAVSFLKAWKGLELTGDYKEFFTFDALTNAFETTGVSDLLDREGGPYTIFAPTDGAIAMVPPAVLISLLADPAALGEVMKYCMLPEPLTYDQMVEMGSLTTVHGKTVEFVPSEDDGLTFGYNGASVQNFAYELRDGSLLYIQTTPQTLPESD